MTLGTSSDLQNPYIFGLLNCFYYIYLNSDSDVILLFDLCLVVVYVMLTVCKCMFIYSPVPILCAVRHSVVCTSARTQARELIVKNDSHAVSQPNN